MSNHLSMAKTNSIESLYQSGHSNRAIAKLLELDRGTVNKFVLALTERASDRQSCQNQPFAPTGTDGTSTALFLEAENASCETLETPVRLRPRSMHRGALSQCEKHHELILTLLQKGLSAKRIHQDLQTDFGFKPSYYSVRRYVMQLQDQAPLPFRRMETLPGEEMQIDFGTAALVVDKHGKKRRPWLFRVVLSYSRKGYSEVVWRQTSDNFVSALENSFYFFGGVPKRLVIDNLKAAVKRADWYDPEIHPKLQSFAAHYGTVFVPTKPYTPEHKGKVESGVKYAKNNCLKSLCFGSLDEQNQHLLHWETSIADRRIHGTTKKQVGKQFEEIERATLIDLPRDRFAMFHEARRTVSRDGHLEVDKAYYSTPPEYVGRRLWVRWDSRMVRIFNDQWRQIATHSKCEPGRFRTDSAHIPREKISAVERGSDALLRQIAAIGPHTKAWSEATLQARGMEGIRVLVGLKALAGKHRVSALEEACRIALSHGANRLRSIRNLLKRDAETHQEQKQLSFIEEHPIIRPLSDYSLESLTEFRRERAHERNTP